MVMLMFFLSILKTYPYILGLNPNVDGVGG
jgi:hypothetical protein